MVTGSQRAGPPRSQSSRGPGRSRARTWHTQVESAVERQVVALPILDGGARRQLDIPTLCKHGREDARPCLVPARRSGTQHGRMSGASYQLPSAWHHFGIRFHCALPRSRRVPACSCVPVATAKDEFFCSYTQKPKCTLMRGTEGDRPGALGLPAAVEQRLPPYSAPPCVA